jgi:cytochrome c oxidase cbb3-type subunit 3
MRCPSRLYVTVGAMALTLGTTMIASGQGAAQQAPSQPTPKELLQVPVSPLHPGGITTLPPPLKNPEAGEQAALDRGMQAFQSMNCVGCHAPNGGGGMGPALSERNFIYGREPGDIFLSIYQGRPNGMPSWGQLLPPSSIWDLVAYIRSISSAPESGEWGRTVSLSPPSPSIQQVPAGLLTTDKPWSHTEPFGYGRKPSP